MLQGLVPFQHCSYLGHGIFQLSRHIFDMHMDLICLTLAPVKARVLPHVVLGDGQPIAEYWACKCWARSGSLGSKWVGARKFVNDISGGEALVCRLQI